MDIKKLSDIQGLTVEEFLGIVEVFIITARKDIENIRDATEKGDAISIGQAAHSLKGAAGNMGFKGISELALIMETCAEKNELKKIEQYIPLVTDQLEDITAQLKTESSV